MPKDNLSPHQVSNSLCRAVAPALAPFGFNVAPGGKLVRHENSGGISSAVELIATAQHGGTVIDPAICVYWREFTELHQRQCRALGYPAPPIACVVRHFDEIVPASSEQLAIYVDNELDIAPAAARIVDAFLVPGLQFIEEWQTPQSALDHIRRQNNRLYPGTWRPSLKYCLINAVEGHAAARAYLNDPTDKFGTVYETKQIQWLGALLPEDL